MRELTWGFNTARIWLNELPNWNYEVAQVIECHLPTYGVQNKNAQCVAVEMLMPIGPMAMYGALGAAFLPEQTGDLLVQVLVSSGQGQLCHNTLAGKNEKAHIGFPTLYGNDLLEMVTHMEQTSMLGMGKLSFCRAMHGEIGSSVKIFQIVSSAIVRLLCLNEQPLSDKELLEVIRNNK